jgi:hypothetical protein
MQISRPPQDFCSATNPPQKWTSSAWLQFFVLNTLLKAQHDQSTASHYTGFDMTSLHHYGLQEWYLVGGQDSFSLQDKNKLEN